jgi:hypothetical protein
MVLLCYDCITGGILVRSMGVVNLEAIDQMEGRQSLKGFILRFHCLLKDEALGIPLSLTLARNDTWGINTQKNITPGFLPLSTSMMNAGR